MAITPRDEALLLGAGALLLYWFGLRKAEAGAPAPKVAGPPQAGAGPAEMIAANAVETPMAAPAASTQEGLGLIQQFASDVEPALTSLFRQAMVQPAPAPSAAVAPMPVSAPTPTAALSPAQAPVSPASILAALEASGIATRNGALHVNSLQAQTITANDLQAGHITHAGNRLRFLEQGSEGKGSWLGAPIHFEMTNPRGGNKRAITMDIKDVQGGRLFNVGGIAISIFTPPDAGGDCSAIWLRQSGGGNALSVYKLTSERPAGYPDYPDNGNAIEAVSDGGSHTICSVSSHRGSAYIGYLRDSPYSTGHHVLPTRDTSLNRRAYKVTDAANSREKFYVTLDGDVYARSVSTARGQCLHLDGPGSNTYFLFDGDKVILYKRGLPVAAW